MNNNISISIEYFPGSEGWEYEVCIDGVTVYGNADSLDFAFDAIEEIVEDNDGR